MATKLAGALLLGFIFNVLNFENGLGWISLSAYWRSVARGVFSDGRGDGEFRSRAPDRSGGLWLRNYRAPEFARLSAWRMRWSTSLG